MRCEAYKQLEADLIFAQKELAMFTNRKYESIRSTSASNAKKIARLDKEKIAAINKQMEGHRQNCEACKQSLARPAN